MSATVWAQAEPIRGSISERLDSIEAQTRNLNAKAGIHFGGNFYSRALMSTLSGNIVDTNGNIGKHEALLFTGLDLSVVARPIDIVSGTAIIRMHHDWRNMFGATANPLTLRWISIDGNAGDFFLYNAGDFRQRYTPLTLWVPEPEIMFEPTVFARQRDIVMNEEFLGNNERILQGLNFNFGAVIAPAFQELRIGGFATRLRQGDKERPNLTGGSPIQVATAGNDMDRLAAAANLDMVFLPGTSLGATVMRIGDAKRTSFTDDFISWQRANNNTVFSVRGGFGSGLFGGIDSNLAKFGINAEFAGSNYREWGALDVNGDRVSFTSANWTTTRPAEYGNWTWAQLRSNWSSLTDANKKLFTPSQSATAFRGGLDGDFRFGAAGLTLDAAFIANQRNFRNEMAQSPAMFRRTVLHSDHTPHWENNLNTFDALYVSAFTYMPGEGHTGTKQPMRKGAWTRSTLTSAELDSALAGKLVETLVSGALHFGEATPNRTGLVADLGFDFLDRAILLQGEFNMLQEMSGRTVGSGTEARVVSQEFMEFGGGLSLDVARLGYWWPHPFILSGSFRQTAVTNFANVSAATNDVSFANAGLYWQFWRRAAVMGGYQFIRSESIIDPTTQIAHRTDQSQWAAGFEFTIAEGGVINATVGQVDTRYWANNDVLWRNDAKNNASALRFDLNLSVKF